MKIFSTEQIRLWDQYTIENEPILSIDLMERAAAKCTDWLVKQYPEDSSFAVFCGKGNNGGDGLAIARMLQQHLFTVTIYILEFGHKGSDDFQTNLARLHQSPATDIHFIQSEEHFHSLSGDEIVIDALFGSGLNRKVEGFAAKLIEHINNSGCQIIAIDIPSGLFADHTSKENITIKAMHTLSFQCYKPVFLVAENEDAVGEIHLLDIGLHPGFLQIAISRFELLDAAIIKAVSKPRKQFAHKGTYGHALIVTGSYGKMGAAILSAKACLRSGVGLLSCHIPKCGYDILQITVPEAMVITDFNSFFNTKVVQRTSSGVDDISKYKAIGIGPGIGTAPETETMLREILNSYKRPLVLDADALNIIATAIDLLKLIPANSILTPHPKEFERLFGESANDFERIELAVEKAVELNCIIILKGHHSVIATPGGRNFFNSTGNAGMATGGSGDVLTGILTGLIAQGYSSVEAAVLGVYLHGMAGDIAAKHHSMEAMLAGDIIDHLGEAFLSLKG